MKYFVADAFTDRLFAGNPAGICIPDRDLSYALMHNIAIENNLSETAFIVPEGNAWRIRWFTPGGEFDLCGHATLASAFIIMNYIDKSAQKVDFISMSGALSVVRAENRYTLDFPSRPAKKIAPIAILGQALGLEPTEYFLARDHVALFETAEQVSNLKPDFELMQKFDMVGLIATAKGDDCDFVSRYFCPSDGIPEDPVTGSAHCTLIPFWSERLQKSSMLARQLSKRGGVLYCENHGDRVHISGDAVLYSEGEIKL